MTENKKRSSIKLVVGIVLVHMFLVLILLLGISLIYSKYKGQQMASIRLQKVGYQINETYPSWFYISKDSMYTSKPISDKEKDLLYNLIDKNDSTATFFKQDLNKLAFLSIKSPEYVWFIYALLILISMLGCMVRNMHDLMGNYCYKKCLDFKGWWPWYVLRPLIAASLAVFLYILANGSLFEIDSLHSTNNLLIISFFVGFAVQDVVTLLRKVSKTLFSIEDKKS